MRPERGSEGRRNQFVQQKANMERGRGGGGTQHRRAAVAEFRYLNFLLTVSSSGSSWKVKVWAPNLIRQQQWIIDQFGLVVQQRRNCKWYKMEQHECFFVVRIEQMLLTVNFMLHLDLSEIYLLRFFLYFVQKMRFSIFIIEPFVNFVIYCII